MPTGKVKWYHEKKGFGFIRPDDGSSDLFVHFSQLKDPQIRILAEGQKVAFDVLPSTKGKRATNIRNL